MTYFGPQPSRQRLELAVFSWTHKASQTVSQSFDISLLHTTWDPAPVVSTGDTLTLPAGHYFAQAFSSISRTTGSQNIAYQFYVDGEAVGLKGQSDFFNNLDNDVADAVFSLTSPATLSLRLTGLNGALPTVLSNSRIALWRTQDGTSIGAL